MTPRSGTPETVEPLLSLRERRRVATAAEISEAALHLFETQGVHNTTVADIARAANVSQRTFFRYFETKEMAALTDLGYADAIEKWVQGNEPVDDVFRSMLGMIEEALRDMAAPDSRDHLLRMRRLIRAEPSIRNMSMRTDAHHTESLERGLRQRGQGRYTELEVIALSRLASTIIRSAVLHWEKLVDSGERADLPAIFRDTCKIMRAALPRR